MVAAAAKNLRVERSGEEVMYQKEKKFTRAERKEEGGMHRCVSVCRVLCTVQYTVAPTSINARAMEGRAARSYSAAEGSVCCMTPRRIGKGGLLPSMFRPVHHNKGHAVYACLCAHREAGSNARIGERL